MIKLGIIGMSSGNAHPYSWPAIINGRFDAVEIEKVGYPAVAAYLQANKDTLGVSGAMVTHVWTQKPDISLSIANTTGIPHIVYRPDDMLGQIDAVMLLRDDAENHVAMARPFIDNDIPVFIDKPLAATKEDLNYFASQVRDGKFIMSCSSQRYAAECRSVKQEITSLGKIELVTAVGKRDWLKYGVHLLEGIQSLMDDPVPISVKHIGAAHKDIVHIQFENDLQVVIHVFMDISLTFQFSVFGRQGWRLVEVKNSYSMFRDNIIEFIRSVQEGSPRLSFSKTENIINILIAARESLAQDGKTIMIKNGV